MWHASGWGVCKYRPRGGCHLRASPPGPPYVVYETIIDPIQHPTCQVHRRTQCAATLPAQQPPHPPPHNSHLTPSPPLPHTHPSHSSLHHHHHPPELLGCSISLRDALTILFHPYKSYLCCVPPHHILIISRLSHSSFLTLYHPYSHPHPQLRSPSLVHAPSPVQHIPSSSCHTVTSV